MEFDYIIVGGGTAGCVLANRLSENPAIRVALCEAGEDTPPGEVPDPISDSFAGFAYLNSRFLWNDLRATTEIGGEERGARLRKYEQACVMGGGSSINGQLANRGAPGDYDEWGERGAEGWNWKSALPYFRKLERDMDFAGPLHGRDGPISISRVPETLWPEHAKSMARALSGAGFDAVADQNGDFRDGYSPSAISNVYDRRISTAVGYLDSAARARPNLHIFARTHVRGLVFDGKTCVGVDVMRAGVPSRLHARETILSAGAIHSPTILMRAGIGPGEALSRLGIPVIEHRAGVGRRLTDHPSVAIASFIRPQARINGRTRRHLMLGLRFSSSLKGAPEGDMAASVASKSAWHAVGSQLATVNIWVNKTYSENGSVELRDSDWRSEPRVDFQLLSDERDLVRLKEAYRRLAAVVLAPEMAGVVTDTFPASYSDKVRQVGALTARNKVMTNMLARLLDGPDALRSMLIRKFILEGEPLSVLLTDDAALEQFIRRAAVGVWHASCSLRMGRADDPQAVTDSSGRVYGVAGLRVVDASLFPSIPCANTNLPTIMLAERMSDLIVGQRRNGTV